MARLPYVDPATAPPQVRDTLAQLRVQLNIFRMVANAETNLRGFLRFGGVILSKQQLDAKLRELAILRVANLSRARYEWVQHESIAKAAGATEEQVRALDGGNVAAACFDARERLVLRFTDEIVRDVRVSDGTFVEIAREFPPREIVELVIAVGFYMMVARIVETLDVDLEESKGNQVVEALGREHA